MTGIGLFLALLSAAYLGGALLGSRRGRGLSSGAEWLVAGFVAGPFGLALLDHEVLDAFRQIALVGVGWVALAVGLEYGWVGTRRIPVRTQLAGILAALATAAAVAAAAGAALATAIPAAGFLGQREHLVLALGVAAALSDTARDAFRWAWRRNGEDGPLRRLLSELADADDLVPIALAAVAFAVAPDGSERLAGPLERLGGEAVIGLALGLVAVALGSGAFRRSAVYATLFGTSLAALGLTARLGLSGLFAGFVLGLVLHEASRHGEALRSLSLEVERPVILPALLLAGASVDPLAHPAIVPLVAFAVGARLVAKLGVGAVLLAASPVARRGGWAVAPAMAAPSPLGPVIGLAFALRFPGSAGEAVLACACASALLGELVSAPAVRAAFRAAGELPAAPEAEPPAAATEAP